MSTARARGYTHSSHSRRRTASSFVPSFFFPERSKQKSNNISIIVVNQSVRKLLTVVNQASVRIHQRHAQTNKRYTFQMAPSKRKRSVKRSNAATSNSSGGDGRDGSSSLHSNYDDHHDDGSGGEGDGRAR